MYVQDYGAPVGWRLALRHPERDRCDHHPERQRLRRGILRRRDGAAVRLRPGSFGGQRRRATRTHSAWTDSKWQFTHGVSDPTRGRPRHLGSTRTPRWPSARRAIAAQLELFADYAEQCRRCIPRVHEYFRGQRRCRCSRSGAATTRSSARPAHCAFARDLPGRRDQPARRRPLPPGKPADRGRRADPAVPGGASRRRRVIGPTGHLTNWTSADVF